MALEALWAITFGTGQETGSGVIVFETGRIFGGDTSFYYIGQYAYNPRDQTISGDVEVVRHGLLQPFIFPGHDGGRVRLSGQVAEPEMILTGHLVQDPQQRIAVHCRHLHDLP
jgi:glyoxylase-like metal-dependent hydrolase (beta-lactamase superfamily II)